MSLHRTALDTGIATLPQLSRAQAGLAQTIAVYSRPNRDGAPTVIVEVSDLHRNLLARSVIDTEATREVAADFVLVDSALERCGAWRVDPIHRHRRLVSMVALRASNATSGFELARDAAQAITRTA